MKIAEARLESQRLRGTPFDEPTAVVRWLGAVQAQDYLGAKWGLALRCGNIGSDDVDAAFNAGLLLRTHIMRPTWHFVAAEDLRWLLELTGPRVQQVNGHMYRKLELEESDFNRAKTSLSRTLEGGRSLTRREAAEVLERNGVAARGLRLAYILMHGELTGLLCSGPLRGKQHTYALLEERASAGRALSREEAMATLARRYFVSHGPATVHDFAWWSGLKVSDAREALDLVASDLECVQVDGTAHWMAEWSSERKAEEPVIHLLPNYDEHVVAYKDHRHSIDPAARAALRDRTDGPLDVHLVSRNGLIIGGWRRRVDRKNVTVETDLLVESATPDWEAVSLAAERFGRFIGLPVAVEPRKRPLA